MKKAGKVPPMANPKMISTGQPASKKMMPKAAHPFMKKKSM